MKNIVILGSTGSIGKSTLEVIRQNKNLFSVLAISSNSNISHFISQILEFKPKFAIIKDQKIMATVKTQTSHINCKFISGEDAFEEFKAQVPFFDCLVAAISGISGMIPTLSLMEKCKILAIANKESVICAGRFLIQKARESNVKILPIDSEHNSLLRLMQGIDKNDIIKYTITASGGKVFGKTIIELEKFSLKDALSHPNWSMGGKITIDSNTMANKALELMEACILFDINYKKIDAIIHTKSIIHGLIESKDRGVSAFLANPNMQIHIANVISNGKINLETQTPKLDLLQIKTLDFHEIPHDTYKAFYLGKFALKQSHEAQIIFNASNEISIEKFCKEEIKFLQIPQIIQKALEYDFKLQIQCIEDVIHLDKITRDFCKNI